MAKRTTKKQRLGLAALGFIRIDGLRTHHYIFGFSKTVIHAHPEEFGRYGKNENKIVIFTVDGEVWLASDEGLGNDKVNNNFKELIKKLCPNGGGVKVPCCRENDLKMNDMLCRLTNPEWRPEYNK